MFIAVTRFSLFMPDSNSWVLSRGAKDKQDINAYINKLYDEDRLNFRISFLKEVTLPLLDEASKGYKFLHILEYSSNLPEKYIGILKELEHKFHFLKLNMHSIESDKKVLQPHQIAVKYFDKDFSDRDQPVGMFVLDDDDCVSLNYFKIMSKYLNAKFNGFAVSLGLGVVGIFNSNYELQNITENYYPKINIGLMRIGMYRYQKNSIIFPRMGSHSKADKFLPTILDSRELCYFWSKHPTQDTKNYSSYDSEVTRLLNAPKVCDESMNTNFGSNFINRLERLKDWRIT
ncbi:glycosyltransferase [Acinetobacter thermotolerans]|uniref:glycosyltransferase n=1 Tax=Acinetobacter thermotolerans TaxID=3151487 RepID=UPI00325B78AB